MMNGNDWGWGFVMMLFWLLFLIIVVAVVTHVLKGHDHSAGHTHKTEPLDIAKERYAKGEITKQQFEQLKKDLK